MPTAVAAEAGPQPLKLRKGGKDRRTMLPQGAREPLAEHLQRVKALHQADLAEGFGEVYLPDALDRKLPGAAKAWVWQYVFPSVRRSVDPRSGAITPTKGR
jgi:hypothetical protein